jgi:hypothetical protein
VVLVNARDAKHVPGHKTVNRRRKVTPGDWSAPLQVDRIRPRF